MSTLVNKVPDVLLYARQGRHSDSMVDAAGVGGGVNHLLQDPYSAVTPGQLTYTLNSVTQTHKLRKIWFHRHVDCVFVDAPTYEMTAYARAAHAPLISADADADS